MALQNDTSRIQYNGNNSTTNSYAIPFVFFANSHIKCVVTTSAGVDTELTLGSGFNVNGAGNVNGGSLTTMAAVPNTSKVTIFRNVPATQTTSYQEGGDFPAASHERALDKLTMIAQQNAVVSSRTLRVSEVSAAPNPLVTAPNTVIGLDVNRNPKAMTADELKSYLALTGTTLDVNAGIKTFADSGERGLAVPEFTGQLGTQRDTKLLYISTGTTAGAWVPFDVGEALVLAKSSNTARKLSDRFSETVNVLDYGVRPNMFSFSGSISGTTLTVTLVRTGYDGEGFPLLPILEVGMIIDAPNVTPMTRVEQVLTGTGGVGTYRVSVSQNVAAQDMQAWWDNRLAIQRAIAGSKFTDSTEIVKNYTFDTVSVVSNDQATPTHSVGQDTRQVPSLIYTPTGGRPVFFPMGHYKISGPLVIGPAVQLVGEDPRSVTLSCFRKQQFNFIEDFYVWMQRQESGKNAAGNVVSWNNPWWIINRGAFNAQSYITGFTIVSNDIAHTDTKEYSWYHWPMYEESGYTLCSGSQGGTTVTLSGVTWVNGQLYVGQKIRFKGNSAVYTIGSIVGNTLTLKSGETLGHTFSNAILMVGMFAQNGIMVSGGENFVIEKVEVTGMVGCGIYSPHGSPAPTIKDTMCNSNDVAYKTDVGPALLLKPSGDGNNVFLSSGMRGFCQTTMVGCKIEGARNTQALTPSPAKTPWPFFDTERCLFELGAGMHTIIGGNCNTSVGSATWPGGGQSADLPMIAGYSGNSFLNFPVIKLIGFFNSNYGTKIFTNRFSNTNAIIRSIARTGQVDAEQNLTIQSVPHFEGNYIENYLDNITSLRFRGVRNGSNQTTWCGIMVDQGSTTSHPYPVSSGWRDGLATFSRSTTTATFTYTNHGFQVGDYVQLYLLNPNVVANFTPLDTDGTTAYSNVVYRVMSVPTNNTFTISVGNAGPTSGSSKLNAYQFIVLHDIKNGEHRIQMPDVVGNVESNLFRPALTIYDKQRRPISGLRVFNEKQGEWWASHKLTIGGTMPFPLSEISFEEVELTCTGEAVQAAFLLPSRIILGVTVRVTQAITGATSFNVGYDVDDDAWGASVPIALNTTTDASNFTVAPFYTFSAIKSIILKANGSNFTGGKVKVACHFIKLNAPQP